MSVLAPRVTRLTSAEWEAEGVERFGTDVLKWKFVCTACGHEQTIEDFRAHIDAGATPESARKQCIGRFIGARRPAFWGRGRGPCDYAAGGLFNICPLLVVTSAGEIPSFGFA